MRALLFGPPVPLDVTPPSLLAELSRFHLPAGLQVFRIDPHLLELLPHTYRQGALLQSFALSPEAIADLVVTALRKIRIDNRAINVRNGQADARFEEHEEKGRLVRVRGSIEIAWPMDQPGATQTPVLWSLLPNNPTTAIEFGEALVAEAARKTVAAPGAGTVVVGPGEPMPREVSGVLLNYTALALDKEVVDLQTGLLPVGKWAFQKPGGPLRQGPHIFVDSETACRGVLVCAAPGTGKTSHSGTRRSVIRNS